MDDAASLEEEFEQELLLEPDGSPPASTPRQRLEDARAMADGNCDVAWREGGHVVVTESVDGDEQGPDTSMHLLQVRCVSYDISRRILSCSCEKLVREKYRWTSGGMPEA